MYERVGIVIPTIGGRPEYLPLTLESIRNAGDAYVVIVGRQGFDASEFIETGMCDAYYDEPEASLPAKINFGFSKLPSDVKYINWIGDDDLLTEGSLKQSSAELSRNKDAAFVFGGCDYIDSLGRVLFTNRSGKWAVRLLRFGPQLIPQPGALYRRVAFEQIGGLSKDYGWAFDFDMFYKLSKLGRGVWINKTLAQFRWHTGSLSVSRRRESVTEASAVRKSHLPRWLVPISAIWEWPIMAATYLAGTRVTKKYLSS